MGSIFLIPSPVGGMEARQASRIFGTALKVMASTDATHTGVSLYATNCTTQALVCISYSHWVSLDARRACPKPRPCFAYTT